MKTRIAALLLGLAATLTPLAIQAQAFPSKPIRLVVPFPAGSATDNIGRTLGAAVSAAIGQQVIVDNKAGADGAIAAADVARAAPDGYTLLMATNSPMSAVPALRKVPPYDPVADFTPITDAGRYTFFIVVHPSVPANSIAELIQYAKANPGKLNYATGNTTGKLSLLQGTKLSRIRSKHSDRILRAYVAGNTEARDWVIRYCEQHGIDVQREDAYSYAQAAAGIGAARAELAACRAAGLPADWVEDADVPFPYRGGVRLPEQAQIDPLPLLDSFAAELNLNPWIDLPDGAGGRFQFLGLVRARGSRWSAQLFLCCSVRAWRAGGQGVAAFGGL